MYRQYREKKVVIATSGSMSQWPSGADPELDPLRILLKTHNISLDQADWDDCAVNWGEYDLVILNRAWSYTEKYPQFLEWLDTLDKLPVRVENGTSTARWNSHKGYMLDLMAAGIPAIETVLVPSDEISPQRLSVVAAIRGWTDVVIKPASCSKLCYKLKLNPESNVMECEEAIPYAEYRAAGDAVLLQPYIDTITTHGEWSVFMVDGVFSHHAVVYPKPGDFRLWTFPDRRPSSSTPAQDRDMLALAARCISVLPDTPLYARVDMLRDKVGGGFIVSELELLEPCMYFQHTQDGIRRLARAIVSRLQ